MATGQGKVGEIWFFFKVREFCKLVREILNTNQVGGKSREFHNSGPKYVLLQVF